LITSPRLDLGFLVRFRRKIFVFYAAKPFTSSGDRVLLALARQEGLDWILELKAFLISSRLPEDESEDERIVH
jgi:hypothetical protein